MRVRSLKWKIVAAFVAVYLIWGSTYLAIRYAVETLPPFTMAGARFVVAGAILFSWARWRGVSRPLRAQWLPALTGGALLLLVGNGGVVWAAHLLPSGLTALLISTEPLWVVLLDWLRPGGKRPHGLVFAGLILGFAGTALLFAPWSLGKDSTSISWVGASAVILASFGWAAGSLRSRSANLPDSPFLSTGMQMLTGGGLLLLAGWITEEWHSFDPATASARSWLAVGYLLAFGSLISFTAYIWLLKVTTPAHASTYAYVNPVVAVLLGWLVAGEAVTLRMGVAAVVIIGGVILIISRHSPISGKSDSGSSSSKAPEVVLQKPLCASE
jgi:drug/metabolite transporter (DMT)-like permease